MIATDLPSAPRNPLGPAPLRRPNSVRRTSSLDVTWPQGYDQPARFLGRARDIYTPTGGGAPIVIKDDTLIASLAQDRTIHDIASEPLRPGIEALAGERGGGYLRSALDKALPQERDAGSPLYLLIDDLSGTSLICRWAWLHWSNRSDELQALLPPEALAQRKKNMEGICTGFRPGSSALRPHREENCVAVPSQVNPQDPLGWHELTEHTQVAMRRARRIDVWIEGDVLHIDAAFQDSATDPAGGRVAIHEYQLQATADIATMTLTSIVADPRILPFAECPNAPDNIQRLLGTPLRDLRGVVPEKLRRIDGCTHLNDAMRALAEVPVLASHLRERETR